MTSNSDQIKQLEEMLNAPKAADVIKSAKELEQDPNYINLDVDKNGNPVRVTENFIRIMRNDPYYDNVKYNLLSLAPETLSKGKRCRWTDYDDAASRHHIENKYNGLYSVTKHDDALRMLWNERQYHPVRDMVDALAWDGQPRIQAFLTRWMKAADDAYSREVSRLIFAGGIHRLYKPGCKFDLMPVLIGTTQGEGKSTIVRWLAMDDECYGEIKSIDDQKGIEQLSKVWIGEMGELLALARAKEVEAIKSFISTLSDKYRPPYNKFVNDFPRQCIFIGTTNNLRFLIDDTGNRRFLPIRVHMKGNYIFDHETEIREYIKQCWAEAKVKIGTAEMYPYIDPALESVVKARQEAAKVNDDRDGMIQAYLEPWPIGTLVCVPELRKKALYPNDDRLKPDIKESRHIAALLDNAPGWRACDKRTRSTNGREFGPQPCWEKVTSFVTVDESDIF